MANSKSKRTVTWSITRLRAHPKQQIFREPTTAEVEELAENIRQHGVRHPPEVLSDGTIITGHKRWEALKRLGEVNVEVIVRSDLDDDPATAEKLLIEDNLVRKQLPALARVRCLKRIHELNGSLNPDSAECLRKAITDALDCDVRTCNRYLQILDLPQQIQNEFEDGRLGFREVAGFARMEPSMQQTVVAQLSLGECVKKLIRRLTAPVRGKPKSDSTVQETIEEIAVLVTALGRKRSDIPDSSKARLTQLSRRIVQLL